MEVSPLLVSLLVCRIQQILLCSPSLLEVDQSKVIAELWHHGQSAEWMSEAVSNGDSFESC